MVRDRRQALGLTQGELAARVGVTRAWVISLEKGKESVELGLVLRTLAALELGLDIVREAPLAGLDAATDTSAETRRSQVTARLVRTLAGSVAAGAPASGHAVFEFLRPEVRVAGYGRGDRDTPAGAAVEDDVVRNAGVERST